MQKSFKQIVKHFFSPDSVDVNLGAVKLKYTDEMRNDVALVLSTLKGKRVLFAHVEHEIWSYVFESLKQIRDCLSNLSGKLHTKAPGDVKSAVDFMLEIVSAYLAEHESNYIRFMQSPNIHGLSPAHLERNWPDIGKAAEDLISLRKLLYAAILNLNQYASTGEILDWEEPSEYGMAKHWAEYAKVRKLCNTCGWNMSYAYDDDCPVCPTDKVVFKYQCSNWGKSIEIAGSFNNWNKQQMSNAWHMSYGTWIHRVKLPPGKYLYKFIIDGEWVVDPDNINTETDGQGNVNSIVIVNKER